MKFAVKWHPDKNPGDEEATKNFQKISEAYATLSDEENRKLIDSDLLHKELQERNKLNGAVELSYRQDLEEAIDEETNERFMVYDCRCGEEIHINTNEILDDVSPLDSVQSKKNKSNYFLVDCPGCCFVYRINIGE